MDLAEALLRLFGIVSHWNMRARGLGVLLAMPVMMIGIADWRIRRRR